MRIGKKLIVSYTLIAILTFVVTGAVLRSSVAFFYTENLKHQLVTRAQVFQIAIDEAGGDFGSEKTQALIERLGQTTKTRITLINSAGEVLADSEKTSPGMMPNYVDMPEVKKALAGEAGASSRFNSTTKQDVLYIGVPHEDNGNVEGVIRIALPVSEIDSELNRLTMIIALIAIGASMLVIGTSYVLSNSFTAPLKRMMVMADRMAHDDLEQRLPVKKGDEIGELSGSLNELAGKLKERIDELKSEKAKADLILDNMAEGILLLNQDGEVLLTNPPIERIFRVANSEVVGKPVIHSIRSYDLDSAIQESSMNRREVIDEIITQSPFRHLRIRIMPITNSLGEDQTLVVIRNISRQKQVERLRKDFVANVSHELKTPLTGLKLISDTLLRSIDTDPASSKIFIKRLDKELSTLINMVRELIDLSKLENPSETAEWAPVDLGEIVTEVCGSFLQLAASNSLSLTYNIEEDIPNIMGDRDQLFTMTRNLIDNAIHYTPASGKITVGLEKRNGIVALAVSDTGIGLAKREVSRIFERFYRVDKARSRETGGTGLGLSLVKHIAENHNATIDVESALGIGSTFYVTFPMNTEATS